MVEKYRTIILKGMMTRTQELIIEDALFKLAQKEGFGISFDLDWNRNNPLDEKEYYLDWEDEDE